MHQPPLLDLLDLVKNSPQDRVPIGKDGLHLLHIARLPAHILRQVIRHQQDQVVHLAGAHRVPHRMRPRPRPKVHSRVANQRRQLRVRLGLRQVHDDPVRQVPRGQRRTSLVLEVARLALGPHAVRGHDNVRPRLGARLGRDLGRVKVDGVHQLAQAELHAELPRSRVQGELEVDAVHVEEGRSVLGPHVLVKVVLVRQNLARVPVDRQRAGFCGGFPEFLLEAPFLEDLG